MSRKGRLRNATAIEIGRGIRNAGDHLGGLVKHENAIAEAAERDEGRPSLRNDGSSSATFRPSSPRPAPRATTSSRRPRKFGGEAWLARRLAGDSSSSTARSRTRTCTTTRPRVGKIYNVKGTAVADVVRLVDGAPPVLIPRVSPPMRYTGMWLT